ncbi:MAG: MOFRL family protein, partial [Balneolaceae bacterium]
SDVWTGSISDLQKKIEDDFKKTLKKKVKKNTALIYYGECTVEVTGDGLGGRNQELALRIANTLPDSDYNYAFLSAGTDGIDGPTDAAGAVVTNSTKKLAKENGLNINSYLKNNDSYHFFRKAGGHLKPGPTGNNLMDLQVLLIDFTSD